MGDAPFIATPPADVAADDELFADAVATPGAVTVSPETTINVMQRLKTRVVRESRRETWFIVNDTGDELATVPVALHGDRSIRRVYVNGEVAEFSASPDVVLVRPRRPLRQGAGTIVVIHYR